MEFETFQEWKQAVDAVMAQAWDAAGGGLAFDPRNPELGVAHVLRDDEEEGWETRQARLQTFAKIMDFVWKDGVTPWLAFKNFCVLSRCGSPGHVVHVEQVEMAVLLNEGRAATSAREQALWQEFLIKAGCFKGSKRPLMKSAESKGKYAKAQAGNVCRKGGKRARRKFSALRRKGPV